jgi:DNA primase
MSVTDEVKSRIDIVELIGSTVQLKKTGRNYKGICPFHSEKTPSFVVFPDSQNWRCFGACGEGGDIFNFVMKREGWDFPEALRYLAEKAGVEVEPISERQASDQEARERLRGLLASAAQFFHDQLLTLPEAEHARQYVAKRWLSAETVEQFGVGYAPNRWDALSKSLIELGYTEQDLINGGLVVVKDGGGTYDRFRDRLVIPIRDPRGNVVGFGARGLNPEAVPKYLNSPQSELFDKSSLLFGLDLARRTIREGETAVIVEGYMDAMQAHQAGFTNVVAQMGTALTEPQLKLLSRFANRLILALDPDTAGQMATDRGREVIERVSKAAAEQAAQDGAWGFDSAERDYRATLTPEFDARGMVRYESRLGFDIRVIVLPEGQDPDDLIRDNPDEWARLVENAYPIVEYVIQTTIAGQNLDDPKLKSKIAEHIVPVINDIANPVERSHYRQRLARLLKIDELALFPAAASSSPSGKPSKQARTAPQTEPTSAMDLVLSPTVPREAACLAALVLNPRLLYQINRIMAECMASDTADDTQAALDSLEREVTVRDFANPEHAMIFQAWLEALSQDEVDPLVYLRGNLALAGITGFMSTLENLPYDPNRIYEGATRDILLLRRRRIVQHIRELSYLISDSDNGGDSQSIAEHMQTLNRLMLAIGHIDHAPRRYGLPGPRGPATNGNLQSQPR